jgi:hypothetical protein
MPVAVSLVASAVTLPRTVRTGLVTPGYAHAEQDYDKQLKCRAEILHPPSLSQW